METPPTTLVIFGATGDLTTRKIIPALFYLFERGRLANNFSVIGASRRPMSENDFREFVATVITRGARETVDQRNLDRFLDLFTYSQVQFEDERGYQELTETTNTKDRAQGKSNRLLYLAVPPAVFPTILNHEGFRAFVEKSAVGGRMARVIVEKPFGVDGESAEVLEEMLAKCFTEEQIYRVDHYLTKDILQTISDFRFENNLLEHVWNNTAIESIHIRLWETIGVESRGNFYDQLGAFRDVGQNHILEMLALTTMEAPKTLGAEDIQKARTELLNNLRAPKEDKMFEHTFRAQHEGYRSITGVAEDSMTETYFHIRAEIDTQRWQGVPIFIEAGKRMHEARKEIIVTFKAPYENRVIFRMEPREEMLIEFVSKKTGILETGLEKRAFKFKLHEIEARSQYIAEYGKMILDAVEGQQGLFIGREEIKATWRFTDQIMKAWENNHVPLASYVPGTDETTIIANAIIQK